MHIFLVNDDGIGSIGIMALLRAAEERGHTVTMCAPASQQSASSQRITLSQPIFVSDYAVDLPGATAYAISGSPADCVRVGLLQLVKEPVDILISGINDGYNAGTAVHYSGTVSAAREGALNGLHAIATSIDYDASLEAVEHLARFTIETAEKYVKMAVPPVTLLNINAPKEMPDQVKLPVVAPLCTANFMDNYIRRESPRAGTYFWLESGSKIEPPIPGSDQDWLSKGHITLTLMGGPTDQSDLCAELGFACQSMGNRL